MSDQSDQHPGGNEPVDPWAPPERRAPQEPQDRVELGKSAPNARPTVHDHPTVTSMPAGGTGAGAVPPPPVAPGGPAQPTPDPYGYPAATAPATSGYGYPPAGSGYGYPGYPGYPGYGTTGWQQGPANGMGITAMVVGIVAVVGFCFYGLGVVLGILALIFGFLGRGKAKRGEATNGGMALAGIILGAIGIVISGAFLGFLIWAIVQGPESSRYEDDPWSSSSSSLTVSSSPR
ncbi:DUF4190 domain-containing protein [Streptomyces sp. NPDC000410]|uniref:DUF4190 domain-containing protein n=1 Tax=Streptomyces sp. NPDC000410 TaxID=3154254 RepID=UPI003330D2BC